MELSLFVPLIFAAVVAVAVVLLGRRRAFSLRRPRPRHVAVRIVCGVIGVGILIVVAIGTFRDVLESYEPLPPAPGPTVRVPAMPAPAFEMPESVHSWTVSAQTRLLVDFVAVDSSGGEPLTVGAAQFEANWPLDRARRFSTVFKAGGGEHEVAVHITAVTAVRGADNAPAALDVNGQWEVVRRFAPGNRLSVSRGFRGPVMRFDAGAGRATPPVNPISTVSNARSAPAIYCFITPAAADDPLKEVPAAEFLASQAPRLARLGLEVGFSSPSFPWSALEPGMPARGLLLPAHIGVSSLLLAAAAILITQVFTSRGMLFPVVLAGVILYVAALDRVALGMNLGRLEDASASAAVRRVACVQATGTFFYGKTALERIEAVGKDAAAPEELRPVAAEAAKRLRGRM